MGKTFLIQITHIKGVLRDIIIVGRERTMIAIEGGAFTFTYTAALTFC